MRVLDFVSIHVITGLISIYLLMCVLMLRVSINKAAKVLNMSVSMWIFALVVLMLALLSCLSMIFMILTK